MVVVTCITWIGVHELHGWMQGHVCGVWAVCELFQCIYLYTKICVKPSSNHETPELDRHPQPLVCWCSAAHIRGMKTKFQCVCVCVCMFVCCVCACEVWISCVSVVNPQRACAARVMVLGLYVSLSVCLSVCLHLFSNYRLQHST